jgi:hypothetical protein
MKTILQHMRMVLIILVCLFFANHSYAADDFVFWPGADYDPAIPSFETVLGYAPGERITWHADAIRYFEALAKAAPERISVAPYANGYQRTDEEGIYR